MILTTTIPTVVTNVTKPKLNFSIDQLVNKDNVLKKSSTTKYILNSDNNINDNNHLSIMSSNVYNDNNCINTPSINNYQNEQKDYGKEIAKALRISTYDDQNNQTLSFNTTATINKSPITTSTTNTPSNEEIKYTSDNIKLPSPLPNDIYNNTNNINNNNTNNINNNNNNLIRPLPIIPTNSDRSNASNNNTNSNNDTNNTNINNNNNNSNNINNNNNNNNNSNNSHNNDIQQSLTTMYQSQLLAAQLQMITKMMSSQSHHPGMQSNHNIPLNKDDEQLAQFRNKFNYQHIPHLINGDVQNTMYHHQNPHHPHPHPHHLHHHPHHAHPSIQPWAINRHGRIFSHRFTGDFLLHPFRKPKRIRTAFAPLQLLKLEHAFEGNQYVVGSERKALAKTLNLTETQVKVWFQNRRTKHKRMQQDDALNTKNVSDDETDNRSSSSSAYKSYNNNNNNNNNNNINNNNNHHHNNEEMFEEDDDEDDDDNESIELDVVTNCHDDIDL